jgi:hypothetical protein
MLSVDRANIVITTTLTQCYDGLTSAVNAKLPQHNTIEAICSVMLPHSGPIG